MTQYRFTEYFEHEVLRKRPYLKKEWCIQVLEKPLRSEPQEANRYRFWGRIEEFEGLVPESGGGNAPMLIGDPTAKVPIKAAVAAVSLL